MPGADSVHVQHLSSDEFELVSIAGAAGCIGAELGTVKHQHELHGANYEHVPEKY